MALSNKKHFPHIGKRILKSAVGVFFCFVIYLLRGRNGITFYSMLAVLWCVQPYTEKTRTMALQRISGSIIGALYGLIIILFEIYALEIYDTFWGYAVISFAIIPVIYTTVLLNRKNASYFSCVVFLSITVMHITDDNPFIFVFNRLLDTFIGIAVGVIVNSVKMPRRKMRDTLFVAELDDMVAPVSDSLLPYSVVEINRMLADGLKLTIATMRTPASLIKPTSELKLNLPVVVMDGAAIYDIKENSYIKAYVMSNSTCRAVGEMISAAGLNCFVNALCDDTLIIYYDKLENYAEKEIFSTLKKSPYRNYINRTPSADDRVIYIMLVDETEKITAFYEQLKRSEIGSKLKVISYASDDYKGFSYIKIYNKNANKHNMIQYLQSEIGAKKSVSIGFGSEDDIRSEGGFNSIVRTLKSSYEPLAFTKLGN